MLQVLFSNVTDNKIPNHKRIDFNEAVRLSHELELQCREEKKVISAEFTVISPETETTLYVGAFNFGSYDYPNIYHRIKVMAQKIKVNKNNQGDKIYLLEQIESQTPEEYKKKEIIDKTLVNLDKSKISKLKKWQRIMIYTLATISTTAVVVLAVSFLFQKVQYETALADGRKFYEIQEEQVKNYEAALLGNKNELLKYLEDKELNENQQLILVDMYLKRNQYEKAVSVMGDSVEVETIILNNDYWANGEAKIKKLEEFDELYPTNEARFDIAYFKEDYELMLNLPTINMTAKRSRMKTYALMKLGKIDEAKIELRNNNDEKLKEKIDKYEVLQAEIKTLTERLEREKGEKQKDDEVIKKITDELSAKKKEFSSL